MSRFNEFVRFISLSLFWLVISLSPIKAMLERGAVSADMRIDAMARDRLSLHSPARDNVMMMERP